MIRSTSFLLVLALGLLAGCDFFDPGTVRNVDSPSLDAVQSGATEAQLQNLVTGLESRHRSYTDDASDLTQMFGSFGREVYAAYQSDPRFIEAWLGFDGTTPDPEFFADAAAYDEPYEAIKQANTLIAAVNDTEAVDDTERAGYIGYAQTIQGFQYLIPLQGQYRNPDRNGSIRIDVSDPLNPGPFVPYDDALADIRQLLDDAHETLGQAGSSFDFTLTSGWGDFGTPAGVRQVNRAIAARAALYAEDWQGALDALDGSFLNLESGEASMNVGAYHSFGAPPDEFNPLFYPRNANTSQILMVHPSMVADALDGDLRAERKFFRRDDPIVNPDLGNIELFYQDNRYDTQTDPVPFIRNEELILIYAEANAQLEQSGPAVDAIDLIRETWGLAPYDGATTTEALIDEILFQRRYSLWAEGGHRWIDARRYDRLDEIPTDLDGGQVFTRLVRPLSEID
jgi:hypothetical protein